VLPAGDCRAAMVLVAALDSPVQLIIGDITTTYVEGHALIKELAHRGQYPAVFFISCHRPPGVHGAAPELNSFTPEALRITVERLLQRGRPETWTPAHTA
jgi:hypothetical protein